jgi:hypothetical protein
MHNPKKKSITSPDNTKLTRIYFLTKSESSWHMLGNHDRRAYEALLCNFVHVAHQINNTVAVKKKKEQSRRVNEEVDVLFIKKYKEKYFLSFSFIFIIMMIINYYYY